MKHKTQTLKIDDKRRMAIKPDGTKVPVIDGKYSFLIQPSKEDIKHGIPGDKANCMYSRACRRLYNSDLVWITRSIAYVELKNEKGEPELQRFMLKDPAKNQVAGFDRGKYATEEAVIFAAPRGTQKLDVQLKTWREWKNNPEKKTRIKNATAKKQDHSIHPMAATLRSKATGMFQFKKNAVNIVDN